LSIATTELSIRALVSCKAMSTQPSAAPHRVFCVKLQREMDGLSEVPFEGHPLGQRIYDNVSKQAWGMWVEHMKMLMNEYRLNLGTKEAQEFLIAADGAVLLRRRLRSASGVRRDTTALMPRSGRLT
jgi:Fe-S cluster biosynthesis and repair protein YggX